MFTNLQILQILQILLAVLLLLFCIWTYGIDYFSSSVRSEQVSFQILLERDYRLLCSHVFWEFVPHPGGCVTEGSSSMIGIVVCEF